MKNILKNYRRRLLNLSASNKALLLLRLSKELHLDVQELDFIHSKPAFSVVQELIAGKSKIVISQYVDSRYARVAPVSRQLRYIKRRADLIEEERGSQELYFGWPFVHGKFSEGTVVRCPLLFFPVNLQVNAKQEWELVQDGRQPHFNQSFLLAYAHYNNTQVAEPLLELDWGTFSKDPLEFRTQLYELLKENQLALNAGRDLFADRLKPFTDLKKKELEDATKPGELYLEPEAVIGIFPQATSYLLNDFDAMLEQDQLHEMEDLFSASPVDAFVNAGKQAQHTLTAFELDASQEMVLQQIKEGRSVVVQGPPGTGKSQLICNLVSDFTARGKKVLVVSQKRAALDVVHQRLALKGLDAFAALVHDIHADRRAIFNQLLSQLEQLENYKKQNLALDSIQTDRAFLETCRGINRCTQELQNFKNALFDASYCGWSAKELYLLSNLAAPHLPVGELYKHFKAGDVAVFLPKLRQYLQRALLFEQADFNWKNRHSFKDWGWPEKLQLEKVIRELNNQYQELRNTFSNLTKLSYTFYDLPRYEAALPDLTRLSTLLQEDDITKAFQQLYRQGKAYRELKQSISALESLYLVCPAPDAAISDALLPDVQKAVLAYEAQQKQLLKKIGWGFSANKKVLKQALAKYNLALDEPGVSRLKDRLLLRQQAADSIDEIVKQTGYALSLTDHPNAMLQKLEVLKQALDAVQLLKELQKTKLIHRDAIPDKQLPEYLQALIQIIHSSRAQYNNWTNWLPQAQIESIIEKQDYASTLNLSLQEHFEHLVAHDRLFYSFTQPEQDLVELLLSGTPQSIEVGEQLFLNSIYLAWLYDLENRLPILKSPSNGELDNLEQELQTLLTRKNELSQEIVLSRLREQTYADMEYNRLGNAVTYRRLQVQVAKKRALYPVRKLFTQFQDEILNLVPCWLASPETVSAVFPLQQCFDLVIFDEASQCFAEVGIPAIVRGKQVVVAGDAQQLRPFDLYRARWNPEEEEETEELVAESLLQLCSLYLPQTMLTQHYRSVYPELIEFSNQHFYRGNLELIPERDNVNTSIPAISYEKVAGIWQDHTNTAEAEKVVQLMQSLLGSGQQDIGVITFNYKQQMLVQDMLEDAIRPLPHSILVKNIENIQGDEKDVIMLSVGYAPDDKGKLTMQFGSLNQAGGENRLNVAVTRARKKVIVVASIEPEQLQVESSLHAGPKLLKAYLQYAREVSQGNFTYQPRTMSVPVHATLLKTAIQQSLPALQPLLPFIDLARKQQQKYESVVLTDDDLYYSQVSVRQSHADVPLRLKLRGWPYQKVYSRQYWADRGRFLEKLN